MLTLDSVEKRFSGGVTALADISLTLNAGDLLVLLGPSGCGKSTLLRLIAGLDPPSAGRIAWTGPPPAAGEIGYVFQEATLMPWANAAQNVALPLRLRGDRNTDARVRKMLEQVGLADFAGARPKTLSGGMRMRVSIARALVSRPKLLLMDEPFAALDEFTRHRLQDDLLHLTRELGCTTVFVTHSLYEAAYLGSRIVLMTPRPGRIAEEFAGSPVHDRLDHAYMARVEALTRALRNLQLAA
jgi:NitT/TauT family transport system ATP-binding protein